MRWISVLLFLPFLLSAGVLTAQDSLYLEITELDSSAKMLHVANGLQGVYIARSLALRAVEEEIDALHEKGYLEAAWIIESEETDTLTMGIRAGKQFHWVLLKSGNVESQMLKDARAEPAEYMGRPISMEELNEMRERIIRFAEDHGYPFATVRLDSIRLEEEGITASLNLEKNELITIDSIVVIGNANIRRSYLANYLGISPDDIYKESLIRNIDNRIRELSFVNMTKPSQVIFIRNKARIRLFLDDRQTSRFNFLVGILPNSDQREGRLLITGEAGLNLLNPFGTGKQLVLEWENLQPRSPQLNVKLVYPYVMSTPIGIDGRFHLRKQDTLYLNMEQELGLHYLFKGNNYLKTYIRRQTTNIISVDTLQLINTHKLPSYLDLRNTIYGIEYHFERLNYSFNPRKGFSITLGASFGFKKIPENKEITQLEDPSDTAFSFQSLYDELDQNSTNGRLQYDLAYYWPIGQYSTIQSRLTGAFIFDDQLFENELSRIGGNQLLRGFDEETVLAAIYQVLTVEYRYLLGQNSYFSVFWDGAYVRRDYTRAPYYPFGFGAGLAFETTAGIFAVNYALGKRTSEESIQFRNAKIHFGYLSYF